MKTLPITPADAIADPNLLGQSFAGASWDRWRAVLKAAYAEPLTPAERQLFVEVAERDPPANPVRELWVLAGRRSGKDSIASAIAATTALGNYAPHLRPGERATVMCLACDRDQARIVKRYVAGYFRTVPLLKPLLTREDDDGLELNNGVEIVVSTNSYRAVRGRTIACVIFDEVSFWRSEDSATPDIETYNAIEPGLISLPDAMLIGISTTYRKSGLAYQKFTESHGKPDPDVLVVKGRSVDFNPLLLLPRAQQMINRALTRDPEAAGAEWLSEWRSDLSNWLDRELIEAAVDDVPVRPPHPGVTYNAFTDPSGGRGDAFTAAVAHMEGDIAVLDALFERRAPFDPSTVVADIAALLREYDCIDVTGDRYAAEWVTSAFGLAGVQYMNSTRDRSQIYLDALPMFTAGRIRLISNERLIYQLISLERRTRFGGRDRVDHPPSGADDLANAVCGALICTRDLHLPCLWRMENLMGATTP
jgi:hypothetical protein